MNFCKECDNYLTIQMKEIASNNKLVYVCKNCGYEEQHSENKQSNCIYINNYNTNEAFSDNKNIQYLDKDNTLPRVDNIACPNEKCKSVVNGDEKPLKNEVVYLIINEQDMVFQYLCCHCKTSWKNR